MDQLFPNQTLYLIENVPKSEEVKESKVEETIFEAALRMPQNKSDIKSDTKGTQQVIKTSKQEVDEESEPELRSPIVCVLGHVDTGFLTVI
jgi:hypothetical protein